MAQDLPRIIRKAEAADRVGLSIRQIERLEAAGKFPRRIKISERASGYLESAVTSYIEQRVAASDQERTDQQHVRAA